jgi:uncharacterized membrane protein YqjE
MTSGKVYEMRSGKASQSHERSVGSILADIRDELTQFVNTRVQVLKTEFQESTASLRAGLPFAIVAVGFTGTAFLLLTAAVVAIVAMAFAGRPYAWFLALAIVGALWLVLGGISGFLAYSQIRRRFQFPRRTVDVLKADAVWLQSETRST